MQAVGTSCEMRGKRCLALLGASLLLVAMACGTNEDQRNGQSDHDAGGPAGQDGNLEADAGVGATDSATSLPNPSATPDGGQPLVGAPKIGLIVFQSTRDKAPGPFCGTLKCSECPPWGTSRVSSDPVCQSPFLRCASRRSGSWDCSRCKLCGGTVYDAYPACQLCDRTPTDEIYLMNEDASAQTRLTSNAFFDTQPDLSSDGTRVVFVSDRDGNDEIYSMKIDGTEVTRLTSSPDAREQAPDWSVNGSIVFVSDRDGNQEIYRMDGDGSAVTRLTTSPARDRWPMFSLDGKRIVFVSNRDGNDEIYAMNGDGSAVTRLTDTSNATERAPAFLDGGKRIIFISNRDGNFDVYSADASSGTAVTRLTTTPATELSVAAIPGGGIVVASDQDGAYQLYSMRSDGTAVTRLTNNAGSDRWPSAALGQRQGQLY